MSAAVIGESGFFPSHLWKLPLRMRKGLRDVLVRFLAGICWPPRGLTVLLRPSGKVLAQTMTAH